MRRTARRPKLVTDERTVHAMDATAPQQQWQLEENSAEAYERYLVPAIMAPSAAQLVERVGLRGGERVLDVACGTGVVAHHAAARVGPVGAVTGLDLNEGMLTVARAQARDVSFVQGDAAAMPFADDTFDAVLCQHALAFVPDRGAVLREMRRVLAPGGRLGLVVGRSVARNRVYAALAESLDRHAGAEAGAMMRSPFPDWSVAELHGAIAEVGFTDVRVTIAVAGVRYTSAEAVVRYEAASSPLAGPLAALDIDAIDGLVAEFEAAIRDCADDEGVVVPLETYVAVARG